MTTTELAARLPEYTRSGMIDLDATMLVVLVAFIGLMVLLKGMLFDPYLQLLEQRRARTEGATTDAAELGAETKALTEEVNASLASARDAAAAERDRLRAEAKAEEERVVAAAREKAQGILSRAQAQVTADLSTAEAELERRAQELAAAMRQRVMPEA